MFVKGTSDVAIATTGKLDPKIVSEWLEEYSFVSGNSAPPQKFIEWIELALTNDCSIRPLDYRHIFSDLRPFKGLSMEYILNAGEIISGYGRDVLEISRDDLEGISEKFSFHIGPSLDLVNELLDPEINFNFISNYFDEPMAIPSDDNSSLAYTDMDSVFERNSQFRNQYSSYRDSSTLLQVPCSFVAIPTKIPMMGINRLEGFLDIIMPTGRTGLAVMSWEQRQAALDAPKWNEKISKAIFRGRTTGINFAELKRKGLPLTISQRFKLHEMAQEQREGRLDCSVPLDFGISSFWQFNGEAEDLEIYTEMYPLVSHLTYAEQFNAKYQVVVDGNGWPDRVASMLLSGSLVFLATIHEDWVIRQLQDGVHYIKVKPDLSDLVEKLEWASSNDHEASKIASNGKEFANKKFNMAQAQVYNALLMMEYQRLFSV